MAEQQSLNRWSNGGTDKIVASPPSAGGVRLVWSLLADDPAPGDPRSCPWCLAAPATFEHRENSPTGVVCPTCHSNIPVGAEWYQRGEKVVRVRDAVKRAPGRK